MIWAISILLATLLMWLILKDAENYERQAQDSAHRHEEPTNQVVVSSPDEQYTEEKNHRAKESAHWTHERRHNKWVTIFSALAAGAASIAAFAAIGAYVQTQRQAKAAEDQVDVAKDTEYFQSRANISAKVRTTRFCWSLMNSFSLENIAPERLNHALCNQGNCADNVCTVEYGAIEPPEIISEQCRTPAIPLPLVPWPNSK